MQDPNDPTYAYHEQTYGEDFTYDDFIPMFTAAEVRPARLGRAVPGRRRRSTTC